MTTSRDSSPERHSIVAQDMPHNHDTTPDSGPNHTNHNNTNNTAESASPTWTEYTERGDLIKAVLALCHTRIDDSIWPVTEDDLNEEDGVDGLKPHEDGYQGRRFRDVDGWDDATTMRQKARGGVDDLVSVLDHLQRSGEIAAPDMVEMNMSALRGFAMASRNCIVGTLVPWMDALRGRENQLLRAKACIFQDVKKAAGILEDQTEKRLTGLHEFRDRYPIDAAHAALRDFREAAIEQIATLNAQHQADQRTIKEQSSTLESLRKEVEELKNRDASHKDNNNNIAIEPAVDRTDHDEENLESLTSLTWRASATMHHIYEAPHGYVEHQNLLSSGYDDSVAEAEMDAAMSKLRAKNPAMFDEICGRMAEAHNRMPVPPAPPLPQQQCPLQQQ